MPPPLDPYRTLGLPRTATDADIKRAYRRLVKQFHPDSAGAKTLARFLAIQSAYEALSGPASAKAEPSAQPNTARAQPSARPRPPRPDPTPGRAAGGTRRASRPEPGERSARGSEKGGGGRRPSGSARSQGGTRGARRATLGSTSYDGVEDRTPAWDGATWYGTSSGTYWTINPKEYADPRKHGPEYQARARRSTTPPIDGSDIDLDPMAQGPDADRTSSERPIGDPRSTSGQAEEPPRSAGSWSWPSDRSGSREDRAPAGASSSGDGPGGRPGGSPRESPSHTAPGTVPWARLVRARRSEASSERWPGPLRRMVFAVLAWLPVGWFVSSAYGELTGCSRATAGCSDPDGVGMLPVHLGVVIAFLLLPRLAYLGSAGLAAVILAAVPSTLILTASGVATSPGGARGAATALLAGIWLIAYVCGILIAVSGRLRPLPWRAGGGS